ncbi:hypothetical protein HGRIS_006334 [Hohenbuehelia grisea]|uniref:RlpA-like protein double-psi beta-barrel domain-containing protein n=1 Tax=Hohenbuehelia grisea TaxID=104357 RepID=A0ABR3K1A1_9AGAR
MRCDTFFIWASTLAAAVVHASPIPEEGTRVLEKRVQHTGQGTWYNTGGAPGNCGYQDNDNSPVVAISAARYNGGTNCNQWVRIVNTKNGKVAYGKTRDSCPGCGSEDLDLTPSLFKQLASLEQGVVSIEWNFMPKTWKLSRSL